MSSDLSKVGERVGGGGRGVVGGAFHICCESEQTPQGVQAAQAAECAAFIWDPAKRPQAPASNTEKASVVKNCFRTP